MKDHEINWAALHEMACEDESGVTAHLMACARALDALIDSHKQDLPPFATASAEVALRKLGEVVEREG